MANMFCSCASLKPLDITNFNTSRVKNMDYMFYDCEALKYRIKIISVPRKIIKFEISFYFLFNK